ncbi:hypothetical protein [Azospirillum oryzae]|uniref:hypothetical protein n=1 Tax=Azospirillum oryzae TaxID=286727 RepID=UPI001B3BB437|nr:hypothetical protein [Azospirillum oryzae]
MDDLTRHEGSPSPLGVSFIPDEDAYNFALYSKHATSVTLLLFSAQNPIDPIAIESFDPRRNKSGRIWHCRLPATTVDRATHYAYRIDGPRAPAEGQRFDHEKTLLDPYATAVFIPPGFSREAARHPGPNPVRCRPRRPADGNVRPRTGRLRTGRLRLGRRPCSAPYPRHHHL